MNASTTTGSRRLQTFTTFAHQARFLRLLAVHNRCGASYIAYSGTFALGTFLFLFGGAVCFPSRPPFLRSHLQLTPTLADNSFVPITTIRLVRELSTIHMPALRLPAMRASPRYVNIRWTTGKASAHQSCQDQGQHRSVRRVVQVEEHGLYREDRKLLSLGVEPTFTSTKVSGSLSRGELIKPCANMRFQ
ncbi:hypothetical protein ONZ51_g11629 [Trametes cubensis]|uniref:Uncharacterized protein n=1 Tax=Trametes cubensis TaxID=1111947 RepID=A0AAD7THC7_9APHY|nr:hypothetical protein ONZ51_g11629 [Trametes cubensis]